MCKGIARLLLVMIVLGVAAMPAAAGPPAQRLPSALLVFPLLSVESGQTETRVEIVNLTSRAKQLKCIFVRGSACVMTNFFITLTPNQPISWLASRGLFGSGTAVPPFFGSGEMKCVVLPSDEDLASHNAVQGRAIVYDSAGQTIGYSAVGFQRLTPGNYTGTIAMNGTTYAQCPDQLHFIFLADDEDPATEDSEIVLVPCAQDVLHAPSATTVVQLRLINEFEQMLSASYSVGCQDRRLLRNISSVFRTTVLGSPTGHLVVRGVQSPVLGMIIDRFTPDSALSTSANEPIMRGGRSATMVIP